MPLIVSMDPVNNVFMVGSSCYTSWSTSEPALDARQAGKKCGKGSISAQLETREEAEQVGQLPEEFGLHLDIGSTT